MPEGMRHQAERHRAGRRAQVEGAVVERLGTAELPGLRQVDGEGVERRVDEALRGAEEEPRRGDVARSGTAAWMRAGASSGRGQATARPTAENTLAATKSAGKPPSRTSCSPSVGASACVARVETPKRPRAAARRPSGANSAASVEAALKPAAKASPCSARSAKIAGPMRSTKRKAPAAADMVAIPPSRKVRRPKRSRSAPTASTLTRPARPLVPITTPIVRSVPPSARTCSGRRKNEAKVRKKQKFAAVTRAKQAVRVEGAMGRSARRSLPRRAAHYTDRAWRRNDGASSAGAASGAASG